MNRFFTVMLMISFLSIVSCAKEDGNNKKPTDALDKTTTEKEMVSENTNEMKLTPPTLDEVGDPDEVAVLETSKGKIVFEFYPDLAPLHVANFKKLANAGFYNGTTFHRVLTGFVIQGGDPNSKDDNPYNDGTGGPPYKVKAEFSDYKHVHGTLSMARSGSPNSAGSQFFICLGRTAHLDGKYTVFGQVIEGLDIVDKIGAVRRDPSNAADRELPAVVMNKVYIIKKSELK